MCNFVHRKKFRWCSEVGETIDPKFRRIKTEGIGYKLFVLEDNKLYAAFGGSYIKDYDGWIRWDVFYTQEDAGFCFFATLAQANKALESLIEDSLYKNIVIRKIQYKQGLGSFNSPEMDGKLRRFCIAKEFKVIDE